MNKNYEVYYFTPDNPQHLAQWLKGVLRESSLHLLAAYGGYWIFEQLLLLDEEADRVGSFAADAMESHGEFYDKAVIALGFSSASLPSNDMDQMMLKKISDLFWLVRNLSDALRVAYEKIPSHWRAQLPFSYFEIQARVKEVLGLGRFS